MRIHLSALVVTVVVGTSASLAAPALASSGVLGMGGHAAVASSRMAVASSQDRTTRWMQVSVVDAASGFLWFVPAAPGARVDLASDAWLDALDDATAPAILPPASPPACDATLGVEVLSSPHGTGSIAPTSSAIATELSSLEPFVAGLGYTLPSDLLAQLGDAFTSGLEVVILQYDGAGPTAVTHTIRMIEPGAQSIDVPISFGGPMALALPDGGLASAPATAFVLASARASLGVGWLTVDPVSVAWKSDGTSTYPQAVESLLATTNGAEWLVESASPGRLFSPTSVPGSAPLPPALYRYFELAAAYGDTTSVPSSCEGRSIATSEESGLVWPLCPRGTLAVVPGGELCGTATPGDVSPLDFACGAGATDAAFALAGLAPSSIWLSRAVSAPALGNASSLAVIPSPGSPIDPVLVASSYDLTCPEAPSLPPSSTLPVTSSASRDTAAASDDPTAVVSAPSDVADAASGGCDGSSDSSDSSDDGDGSGACDGNTSSSDDDPGGCSGSSTSTAESSDCTAHRAGRRSRGSATRMIVLLAAATVLLRRRALRSRRNREESEESGRVSGG